MPKSIRLFAVMIGALIVTMFLLRHTYREVGEWLPVALIMTVIYLPFGVPRIGNLVATRPKATFWIGIWTGVAGMALFFALIFFSSLYGYPKGITGDDLISSIPMYILMVGIALTVLPRGVLAYRRLEPSLTEPKAQMPKGQVVGGIGEAIRAFETTALRIWPFLRVAGVWIFVLWAAPLLGLFVASNATGKSIETLVTSTARDVVALDSVATRLPTALALLIALPTALVAWHRFLLEDQHPRFIMPLPDTRAIRYSFRLWIMLVLFSVLVRVAFTNGADLARLLHVNPQIVSEILYWSILLAGIYLGSSYALVLPAIAAGNRQFVAMDSLTMIRSSPNSYRIGFLVSLLPFALVGWSAYLILGHWVDSGWLLRYALQAIPLTLVCLGFANCATYLSHVYENGLVTRANRSGAVAS